MSAKESRHTEYGERRKIRDQPDCTNTGRSHSFCSLNADERDNVRYSLAEQGESSEAVQELVAAALVEVQSGQGGGRLLQPEDHEGPAFLFHRDGPELIDGEGQRPPAPLVAVVNRDCGSRDAR